MIWRPPGADYYGWLVGMQWPEGNEDRMWDLANDWKAAATNLDTVKADIDAAISAVRQAYPEGDGGDAMLAQLNALKYGDLSKDGAGSIDSFVKWFESIAGLAENTGTEFEYTKLMFNAMLLIMAVDMVFAACSLVGAPAAEAAIIAANRVAARTIMKQLLKKLVTQGLEFAEIAALKATLRRLAIDAAATGAKSAVLGAAMGTVPDAAIQLWQMREGHRQEFRWDQFFTMAAAGAAGGVAAAGIGSGMRGLFGMPVKMTTRVATTGVTMLAAGGGAGIAGWGASALITGQTELDPRMITAGMWGGAAPGAMRSVKPKMNGPKIAEPTAPAQSNPAAAKSGGTTTAGDHSPSAAVAATDGAGSTNGASHLGDPTGSTNGHEVVSAGAPAAGPAGEPQAPVSHSGRSEITGAQVPNGQNVVPAPVAHQSPGAQSAAPRIDGAQPAAAQPAAGAHPSSEAKTPPENRPLATRTEPSAPNNPAADRPAGAAPSREAPGQSPHAQAKATGVEVTSRAERLDATSNDRANIAADRPNGMISGRHDDAVGGDRSNLDGAHNEDTHGEQNPQRGGDTNRDGHADRDHPGNRDNHADRDGHPNRDGQVDRDGQPARDGQQDRTGQPAQEQPSHDQRPSHPEPSPSGDHAPRPVLPVDHPITAADHQHAADALAKLGHDAEPRQLLHADNVDQAGAHQKARENHDWWHELTPDQQSAMTRLHPHEIGNADGVPPHVRDQANRLSIARDLAELRERNPRVEKWTSRFSDPEGRQQFQNLQSTIRNLEHAETLADTFANRDRTDPSDPPGYRPPVHVLSYDSKAFNGEGRAVVAIGDVDHASTVSFHIPGITTTVRSLEVNLNNAFNHFWATSDNVHDPSTVASIAWIGYDAPSGSRIGREMTNPLLAQRGGQLLARDVAAFNQTRKINAGLPGGSPPPDVHLFGHSYGSTTTSYAGSGGRLTGEVSTITLLGSPGAGPVVHASEFGIGAENVFVASSSRDPVTWIGSSTPGEIARAAPGLSMGLGMDPSVEAFGARRVIAQFPGGAQTFSNIGTHTGYYKFHDDAHSVPSESLYNFAKIAAGDKANIIPEFARPDHESLNAWQRNIGSLPSDPAHLRPPVFDPHEGAPFGYEHLVDEFRHPDAVPEHPTLPADHQPVNDCGPQALRHAQELTGNENIRIPHDPEIAERGMTAHDLETAAGGRMQRMETPGVLADHLTRLGEGATAIVVSEFHGPTDTNGIGAHAYTVTNDGGRLVVHDSAVPGGPHPFPAGNANVRATYAVLYDSHGSPVRPIDSAVPVHPGAHPEVRIGQPEPHGQQPGHEQPSASQRNPTENPATQHDSIRRFDTDDAGLKFGDETMGSHMDSLSEAERQEVSHYVRHAWINELLRDPDPGARFTQLVADRAIQHQLTRLNEGKSFEPSLELLKSYDRYPNLDPPLRASLDNVLRDPHPQQRLSELWSNAQDHMVIERILDTTPTGEILNQHVQTLDRLTDNTTPQGFEIQRGIGANGVRHLTIDNHGTMLGERSVLELKGTLQTERGYLSTSLGEKPPGGFKESSIRIELDVPAGSKGLWIGGSEHEFLMPRGTRYLITDVIESPSGSKYEGARYLIRGTVVGADYVHEPRTTTNHGSHLDNPAPHGTAPRDVEPTPHNTEPGTPLDSLDLPPHTKPELEPVDKPSNLNDISPQVEPKPAHPIAPDDRPETLTPHLQGRFDELKSLATEISSALRDPDRHHELPHLRDDFVKVLDKTGFMDRTTAVTPWRLLTEHDPTFRDYLGKYGNDLLTAVPEPRTPTHQEPASGHPASENPQHSNASHPHENPTHSDPGVHPAKETEAGASFHPDDPVVSDLASRISKDPNHFTADVHITEDGHARIGDRTYTPEEFANLLRGTSWDGKTPIRLVGCDAAANGFAARLAHHLGVDVMAPTKPAWSDSHGRLYTSTAELHPDGTRRPRIPPDGAWETHHPDGTKSKATEDGFAPGTREEDKHQLDPNGARFRGDDESQATNRTKLELHPDSPFAEPFNPPDRPGVTETALPGIPFGARTDLEPHTRYDVEGRGTFWTDENGRISHIEAETPNTHDEHNPDVRYGLPKTTYRVHTDQGTITFVTDHLGNPPRAAAFDPPNARSFFQIGDPEGGRAHATNDAHLPKPPKPGEGFSAQKGLPHDAEIKVYDSAGNYVGTFHTNDSGKITHLGVESGRQYRGHPELGKNVKAGVQYRLSPDFDITTPHADSPGFHPPSTTHETRVVLEDSSATRKDFRDARSDINLRNQLDESNLTRRPSSTDPFVGRNLEPNHKYVVEVLRDEDTGLEPYGVFYTDSSGKVVAVDTFKPFNKDLIDPPGGVQINVENGPTVINTREPVDVPAPTERNPGRTKPYVGPHAISHEPEYAHPHNKLRRDNAGQTAVGNVGRGEFPEEVWAGGHGMRNAEKLGGENSHQVPQLDSQNSGRNLSPDEKPQSWYDMENGRVDRNGAGIGIGPINLITGNEPHLGTPPVMWQVWTETPTGGSPEIWIRSFWNV